MMIPAFALLLVLSGSASADEVTAANDERWVEVGDTRYSVEIAADYHSRMRGLMFRESLPERSGMLFVFASEYPQSFWMKNTLIPLDILYFDSTLSLVSVSADTPPCEVRLCPSYPSAGPARFVLELNAGEAARLQLKPGDRMTLGPGVPSTPLE